MTKMEVIMQPTKSAAKQRAAKKRKGPIIKKSKMTETVITNPMAISTMKTNIENVVPSAKKEKVVPSAKKQKAVRSAKKEKAVPSANKDKVVPSAKIENVVPSANIEKVVPSANLENVVPSAKIEKVVEPTNLDKDEVNSKYPILNDKKLIQQFLNVPMSNNQKGRIRQAVKESLTGTSDKIDPDIVNNKIQSIISNGTYTNSELRRIRILYNMLKTAISSKTNTEKKSKNEDKVNKENKDKVGPVQKKKEKRYVVFLGNLPMTVTKDKILKHFSEMNEHIKHIRIPRLAPGKSQGIAYLELTNEASYEFALSKHHSMMGSKRINVQYTKQKKSKISDATLKSKSAKLAALQKSGKLVGSVPLKKKRSQRRLKKKQALAKEEQAKEKILLKR